jgi:CheY-like chemotaxis protein
MVDDNALIRDIVRTRLQVHDCRLRCRGWYEGIKQAKMQEPDLIILDFSMPVMNGLETALALKILMPQVPLMMFTNMAGSTMEQEAREAGISAVVSKSGSTEALFRKRRHSLF